MDGNAVLDAKFRPAADRPASTATPRQDTNRCNSTSAACYAVQRGSVHNKTIRFYNLGAPAVTLTATATSSGGANLGAVVPRTGTNTVLTTAAVTQTAYDFPTACAPGAPFDPVHDAYTRDTQFPVFSALPLVTNSNTMFTTASRILPIVKVFGVDGVSGNTCNDIKTSTSIGAADGSTSGKFGAVSQSEPTYQMWIVIDGTTSALRSLGTSPDFPLVQSGWYKNLQLTFINGGTIPTDGAGNLVAMDGVILNPTTTSASDPTDQGVVILPFQPGEAGYSPIVRVHNWVLPVGKTYTDYTGLCNTVAGQLCGPNDVDVSVTGTGIGQYAPTSFSTLFIAALPPQ